MKWQPIYTAPHGHDLIWLWGGGLKKPMLGGLPHENGEFQILTTYGPYRLYLDPTHWMPAEVPEPLDDAN